jgi:hypothetical protein
MTVSKAANPPRQRPANSLYWKRFYLAPRLRAGVWAMCAFFRFSLLGTLAVGMCFAATLEQMSLDDLIQKSTSIVRGHAVSIHTVQDGALIYTVHRFKVAERWKGATADEVEIALPGGSIGGVQQRFGGVPQMEPDREFVVFLWQGPSGRTQITGLSQGLFEVSRGSGSALVRRKPNADVVIVPKGGVVESTIIEMPLADLAALIRQVLQSKGPATP